MSYNIDTWRTKVIENLTIPISAIEELPHVEISYDKDGNLEATGVSEGFEIKGKRAGDSVVVTEIRHGSEGSGYTWDDLKECLGKSKGKLIAVQVWEGGDSISRLTCIDGAITDEPVEL